MVIEFKRIVEQKIDVLHNLNISGINVKKNAGQKVNVMCDMCSICSADINQIGHRKQRLTIHSNVRSQKRSCAPLGKNSLDRNKN